jgi:septum formation protein
MIRLILASQSPRRKEILSYFTLPFEQVVPPYCEESVPYCGEPERYVKTLSEGKNRSLERLYPSGTILSADTIVCCEGKLYGKPESLEQAIQFLNALQGKWHTVMTAVSLSHAGAIETVVTETNVLIRSMDNQEIAEYLHRIKWSDKAGGYMVQQGGGMIVERIEGCFTNVMGLPIGALNQLFKSIGIHLTQWIAP